MPIDIATGNVELARDDFVLPGRVPVNWARLYRSTLLANTSSPLGPGWTTSWFSTLQRVERTWQFSHEGVLNSFPNPDDRVEKGEVIRLFGAFLELNREADRYVVTHWNVESGDIQRFVFAGELATDKPPLVAVENVSGDGIELRRDVSGRVISLRQQVENRTVLLDYSPTGSISSLALVTKGGSRAELVRYEYDESGRLSAAFDRRELANRYEYDVHSRVGREILKDGAVYSYRYDHQGRCIHFTGLDHYNEKRLRYLDATRTTIVTNSYEKSTTYEYLPTGQIVAEVDPLGNRRRTEFDELGRTVAKVDPLGAATRYAYDQCGNRCSITDPLGHAYEFKFNEFHQPLLVTNPLGKTWLREYDDRHRLIVRQNPLGSRWTISYDAAGNPSTFTDPLGSRRTFRFSEGLAQESSDWMGHVTRFRWDEFGHLIERIGPTGERTVLLYDQVGNVIEIDRPDGGRLRASYDAGNNISSVSNTKGHSTRLRYGPCRRLLERTDPLGRVVRYGWGTEPDRIVAVENEKGEIFRYFHDDLGRVVRERSFDGREMSFEYDPASRCIAVVNGNGERIQIKRDAVGRRVEQALPDGSLTTYAFDATGSIIAAVNPDVSVSFEYDDVGRLIREIQGSYWVRTQYNVAGKVIGTITSLGCEVRYELDPNGRVMRLHTGDNQSLFFERDPRGLEITRHLPGELRLEQEFDPMGRLLKQRVGSRIRPAIGSSGTMEAAVTYGGVVKRNYEYDPDGALLSISEDRWGSTNYDYDPAERVLGVVREQGPNEWFEYDVTDNLTRVRQQLSDSTDETCTYGPGNRLLRCADTWYEYDGDGRLIRRTEAASSAQPRVWEFTWDALGQLRTLRRPDGKEWTYQYDYFGRRIAKLGPGVNRRFLWDGNVVIQDVSEDDQARTWIMERTSFAPLATLQGGTLYSIITDHLGTPREMIDSSGKLVWQILHAAWGHIYRKSGRLPEQACPIRFQGQWFDEESGLHYNRFRYYDPMNGRFISQDPVSIRGGRNLYAYSINPIIWTDPFGLECTDEGSQTPGEDEEVGIVYLRTDEEGNEYVGQAKSEARYEARQGEHDRANPESAFTFEELERVPAGSGRSLNVAEEDWIRAGGNPSSQGGQLDNRRHQMSEDNYAAAGGTIPK